jgi:hypothetical protein
VYRCEVGRSVPRSLLAADCCCFWAEQRLHTYVSVTLDGLQLAGQQHLAWERCCQLVHNRLTTDWTLQTQAKMAEIRAVPAQGSAFSHRQVACKTAIVSNGLDLPCSWALSRSMLRRARVVTSRNSMTLWDYSNAKRLQESKSGYCNRVLSRKARIETALLVGNSHHRCTNADLNFLPQRCC